MAKVKKGARVRCAYREGHTGIVLSCMDPRAWAGTLAFPDDKPDAHAVREHVLAYRRKVRTWAKPLRVALRTMNTRIPVLYPWGVCWDSQLEAA